MSEPQVESDPDQHLELKAGLKIETGINRGSGYTDLQGTRFNLRYRPVTITNDNAFPVHLQIVFSERYEYPEEHGSGEYNVMPLPKQWGLDGVEVTDEMKGDLKDYVDMPALDKILEPGEELVMAIGTRYRPTGFAALPGKLFAQDDSSKTQGSGRPTDQDKSTSAHLNLELRIDFYLAGRRQPTGSVTISCGQVSVPE